MTGRDVAPGAEFRISAGNFGAAEPGLGKIARHFHTAVAGDAEMNVRDDETKRRDAEIIDLRGAGTEPARMGWAEAIAGRLARSTGQA